jgi:hypothetical protein
VVEFPISLLGAVQIVYTYHLHFHRRIKQDKAQPANVAIMLSVMLSSKMLDPCHMNRMQAVPSM